MDRDAVANSLIEACTNAIQHGHHEDGVSEENVLYEAAHDVSTPTEPRWLGEAPGSASVGMEIVGQMAYLIHNSGAQETLKLGVFELDAATGLPRGILSLDLGVRVRGEYGGITHEDGNRVHQTSNGALPCPTVWHSTTSLFVETPDTS